MTSQNRPRKRQRSATREGSNETTHLPRWNEAIDKLIERLNTVKSDATALRDEQRKHAEEISERIANREAASRAVAKVNPPPPSEDVNVFSKGVRVEVQRPLSELSSLPPLPAMKLLAEPDPPEKLIHEQSVIVRAQAINRKNAELARERLPKQPEAKRNKTFHDCFLEETLWMATDFREERKWKIHMAKKVSKLIMQYHSQKESRIARAKAEEHQRVLRLASSIARDVRRFWNQIGQLADYRVSVVEQAKRAEEGQKELEKLLKRTARYTSIVGKNLVTASSLNGADESAAKRVSFSAETSDGAQRSPVEIANGEKAKEEDASPTSETPISMGHDSKSEVHMTDREGSMNREDGDDDFSGQGGAVKLDDESTLIAAEAEEPHDTEEISRLEGEAAMSVEELLRSQGIDPAVYKADQKCYLESEDEQSDHSASAKDEHDPMDDESTIKAAEELDTGDEEEIPNLEREAALDIIEILKSQGIDPEVYNADTRRYTRSDSETSSPESPTDSLKGDCEPDSSEDAEEAAAVIGAQGNTNFEKANCISGEKCNSTTAAGNGKIYQSETLSKDHGDGNASDLGTDHPAVRSSERAMLVDTQGESSPKKLESRGEELFASSSQVASTPRSLSSSAAETLKSPRTARIPVELLRGTLRPYQKTGMDWLISLFQQSVNGILADEMGLGKTIQAISLLAWLAVERGIWGPHLVVVPTSVIVNWEVEFKKWLPGFKVLTYFGNVKERKLKRQGWTKANTFHVCITSYNLAVQDASALRRKKWVYLILDEAHNIKNFESQRWQTLLSFSSQRRLLITGTPLQNSVMELWSLMHFLMPNVFESHSEFKDWFSKPLHEAASAQATGPDEKTKIVSSLHNVLRPFLLRRLKADVEKGLPPKFEHVIKCPLSKRQRQLYEDFMARSDVRDTLQSGDFFSVMNVLMQLRKVCNHPDLFEGRRILSPLTMRGVFYPVPALVTHVFYEAQEDLVNLDLLGLNICSLEENWLGSWYTSEALRISAGPSIRSSLMDSNELDIARRRKEGRQSAPSLTAINRAATYQRSQLRYLVRKVAMIVRRQAIFGEDLRTVFTMTPSSLAESIRSNSLDHSSFVPSNAPSLIRTMEKAVHTARPIWERYVCCVRKATAPVVEFRFRGDDVLHASNTDIVQSFSHLSSPYRCLFRPFEVRSKVTIPDTRLVQWDCGKLQVLDELLRILRRRGSRALIFTQMTKVLDVLESFFNLHSLRYLRLDGTTKTDDRQKVVERFNTDKRIFCMILTTRAGGVGLNLTGADSVIFYDTDYNPAVDSQAQDRVHRIGQTKPVHIYRLVSEDTVEENILRRANEKRNLETMVISDAGFTTEAIASQQVQVLSNAVLRASGSNESNGQLPAQSPLQQQLTQVQNGRPASGAVSQKLLNGSTVKVGSVSVPSALRKEFPEPAVIATAAGRFDGFVGMQGSVEPKGRSNRSLQEVTALTYQDVTSRLLAEEDDRERIAMFAAAEEERELQQEFEDTAPSETGVGQPDKDLGAARDELESSLTPVQKYALRLVESWRSSTEGSIPQPPLHWEDEFTVDRMLERRSNLEQLRKTSEGVVVASDYRDQDPVDDGSSDREDDDHDPLFYELDTSEIGRKSYLKALTDTDADIKLYLPLRDGGPEELKVSKVVSGTAAAGLECAEDAAFFPHAYNRMSRTMYATQRQKEKARANMRKRKLEREARRRKELEQAAVAAAAAAAAERERELAAARVTQAAKVSSVPERQKAVKSRSDQTRGVSGSSLTKKARSDNSAKLKGSTGIGSSSTGGDGPSLSSHGLFKKSTKKAARRLISAGKAALVGSSGGVLGEGSGLNDGWTKDEDMSLIAALSTCNNNMLLVSDTLRIHPLVRNGVRRKRSYKHCLDRLLSTLQKDGKSGQLAPKATEKDMELFRKHQVAIVAANKAAQRRPPGWLALPNVPTEKHPSQLKVIAEAAAKPKGKFRANVAPTLIVVGPSLETPEHFRSGYKPIETTPEAMNRKRFPFLRPPRDESKAASQRSGPTSRQGGSQRGAGANRTSGQGQGVPPKTNSKQGRGSSASGTKAEHGAIRQGNSAMRSTVQPRVRGLEMTGGGGKLKPQIASVIKKGTLSGTSGGRISIGQVGGSIQKLPGSIQNSNAVNVIGRGAMNKISAKGGGHLQSGRVGAAPNHVPAIVRVGGMGSNGVVAPTGVKVQGRNTSKLLGSVGSHGVESRIEMNRNIGGNRNVAGTKATKPGSTSVGSSGKEKGGEGPAAKGENVLTSSKGNETVSKKGGGSV